MAGLPGNECLIEERSKNGVTCWEMSYSGGELSDSDLTSIIDFLGDTIRPISLKLDEVKVRKEHVASLAVALAGAIGLVSLHLLNISLDPPRDLDEFQSCFVATDISLVLANSIAKLLKNTRLLKDLCLEGFRYFSDEAVAAISISLAGNKSLEVLKLVKCRIGDEGAKQLLDALKQNLTLTSVEATNSGVSEGFQKDSRFYCYRNVRLGNRFSDIGITPSTIGSQTTRGAIAALLVMASSRGFGGMRRLRDAVTGAAEAPEAPTESTAGGGGGCEDPVPMARTAQAFSPVSAATSGDKPSETTLSPSK